MKKAERLNWIVMTLKQRGRMSASELARYMEVSPRTIYRDMTALSEIRVPVMAREGAEGGYEIEADYFLPTIRLNDREILVLLILLKSSEHLHMGDFQADIRTLGHKLLEVCQGDSGRLERAMERIQFERSAILPEGYPEGLFSLLVEAFLRERRIRLAYFTPLRGEVTKRTVSPLGLSCSEGCWYLDGYCHARRERRTFRLDRIREAHLLDLAADLPASTVDSQVEPDQEVRLEMDPRLFDLIKGDEGMQGAQVLSEAEGRLLLRLRRRRLEYLEGLAFRNLDQVTVLGPPALLQTIRAKLGRGLGKYGAPPEP